MLQQPHLEEMFYTVVYLELTSELPCAIIETLLLCYVYTLLVFYSRVILFKEDHWMKIVFLSIENLVQSKVF